MFQATSFSLRLSASFSQHIIKQGQQSGHSKLMTVTLVSLRINKATGQANGGGAWKCVSVCGNSVSFCDCQQNGFFFMHTNHVTQREPSHSDTHTKSTHSVLPPRV